MLVDNIRLATIVVSIKEPRLAYPRFNQVGFCFYRVMNNLHSKETRKRPGGVALFRIYYWTLLRCITEHTRIDMNEHDRT